MLFKEGPCFLADSKPGLIRSWISTFMTFVIDEFIDEYNPINLCFVVVFNMFIIRSFNRQLNS
jgi:hypothetical protein